MSRTNSKCQLMEKYDLDKSTIEDSISKGMTEYKQAAIEITKRFLFVQQWHETNISTEKEIADFRALQEDMAEIKYMLPILEKYEDDNKPFHKRFVKE